ncbi:maltooligosyl trehalose synthase [Streptomyces sp. DvalAA-14]|uniref:malto-oligosyltrehalose synthase n=1 Tax=unclassified Streptomyces TaxID=2593676 RepID=UPI00081B973E|nr:MULTISPECIES: malto-oligosyltrehalose synthase [unclassified Streptomyces]MYS18749.1 malto-oligosyltrehalose synthase [Streptomyces sp. SID4948]SCD28690.1 maltooligosyl trehalose synthase [Streptomyces sp. DvalAA-14]
MTTAPAVTPASTYRVQLQPGFTFADTAAAVPYLAELGVTHLHLSPVLEAVPGSTHGYDVVDHQTIRAELGGEQGLRELSRTAREHGLGLILDIVPNHMAVPTPEYLNGPLWQVLRDGPASPYASWFDIDWAAQDGKVLLPVLGEPLPDALGSLSVVRDEAAGGAALAYYDHRFPLRPGTEELPPAELVEAQHYRLAYWRAARTELNYRRFFTISDLIAVRVELPEVFEATHATVLRLLRDGVADGLRIDHPDGLADPAGYLRQLARACGGRWTVVEKILQRDESLPADWDCAGTTGYDALDRIDGLFTDPVGAAAVADFYREFTGIEDDRGGRWAPTVARAGYRVVSRELSAEVSRLERTAERARAAIPGSPPYGPEQLADAIRELLLRVPVYRPYVVAGAPATAEDTAMLEHAAAEARRETAPELAAALDFVRDLALGRAGGTSGGGTGTGGGADAADFVARFAQVASALHAKSVEDAAFYRYVPLLSLNEVGRDPAEPATTPAEFHAYCERMRRERPATGTVLSTHDTKRSADLRLRLAVLSELPDAWRAWLGERPERGARLGLAPGPDRHTEYTVFQTGVGLGACRPERLVPAALKAVREAGLHTTWTEQDEAYEKAVAAFTEQGPCGVQEQDTGDFAATLHPYEQANVLGAALLQLTMPGVPDLYQGTEWPVRTLVDPDNRAPMNSAPAGSPQADAHDTLRRLLEGATPDSFDEAKLRLTAVALRLRREHPEWYGPAAAYEPRPADGPAADHCVAYLRGGGALTAVTRLSRRLEEAGGWRDTVLPLPPGRWRDRLGGGTYEGRVPLAELLADSPVVLLTED